MNEENLTEDWFFTFGYGSRYEKHFIKLHGTFETAREEMVSRFGLNWAFQYSAESFAGQQERYDLKELVISTVCEQWPETSYCKKGDSCICDWSTKDPGSCANYRAHPQVA